MKQILLALLFTSAAWAEPIKGRVAVMDLVPSGADPAMTKTLTRLLSVELSRSGAVQTVGSDDVAALIGIERQRQLMGCNDSACLADLGALDARYVLTGTVGKVGSGYVVSAQILDTTKAQVVTRAVQRASNDEQLAAASVPLARELLAETATLHLYNQVAGASVFLDDRFIGKMPLDPVRVRESGKHTIRAESVDHLPFESAVELEPGRTSRVRVDLLRFDELEAKSRSRKIYAGATAAVASGAGAGCFLVLTSAAAEKQKYDDLDPLMVDQPGLDAQASVVRSRYVTGYALGGAALTAAIVAVYLIVTDPYDDALKSREGVSAGLFLAPQGGAGATLGGRF